MENLLDRAEQALKNPEHGRGTLDEGWIRMYYSHRDAGIRQRSNAEVIERCIEKGRIQDAQECPEEPEETCFTIRDRHWAVGHVDGMAIKPIRVDGKPSHAFREYCECMDYLESEGGIEYGILDYSDYREKLDLEACEVIRKHLRKIEVVEELAEDMAAEVLGWMYSQDHRALEERGSEGVWFEKDVVVEALRDLGYIVVEEEE